MTRASRGEWAKRVRRWRASELIACEFAAHEGWNARTLTWWSSQLNKSRRETPRFVDVTALVSSPPATTIDVVIRETLRLRVSAGFDAELLRGGRRSRGPLMLPTRTRMLVCREQQDMRRSFRRLAAVARDELGEDPPSGTLFVFVSKSSTRVKVLWWDRNGYCLLYKRLHHALFRLPRDGAKVGKALQLDTAALAKLLTGVPHEKVENRPRIH